MSQLRDKTINGIACSVASQVGQQVLGFVTGVILDPTAFTKGLWPGCSVAMDIMAAFRTSETGLGPQYAVGY